MYEIKQDKEKIILGYIIEYPTQGSRRIANELKQQQNITISEAGVYLCYAENNSLIN